MRRLSALSVAAMAAAIGLLTAAPPTGAQPPSPPGSPAPGAIDFKSNIKRVFDARCVACHGPDRQQGGLRLDSREAAMKGGAGGPVIIPGKSGDSRLFEMVSTGRMPLDDELSVLELNNLRLWIDQGAHWPEPRAVAAAAVDPRVEAWRVALRNGDRRAAARLVREPGLARAAGRDGVSPLHYAALYGDVSHVRALLDAGANVNARDAVGVTPLMWGLSDGAKSRLLIERGADLNAVSEAGDTALVLAAGLADGGERVRFLLDKGAMVRPDQTDRLALAAGAAADPELLKVLFPRVLDPKSLAGAQAAADAARVQCLACLDYLIAQGVRGPRLGLALVFAANAGDATQVKRLLDLGAALDGRGPQGATALIAASTSDVQPVEKVRLLLEAGADPNLSAPDGRTAIGYARTRHPEIVPLLQSKGAR